MTIRIFKGNHPEIGDAVYVDEQATVIGTVKLGNDVSIWPGAVVRGDVNTIEIGPGTNIQDCSVLHGTHDGPYTPGGNRLVIGQGVTVGHRAIIHACTVGDYCLIGMGAVLMDGVFVEDQVIVGAGSLVPVGRRLDSAHLYLGSPVKKIRSLTDTELESLEYSAKHYQSLKNQYLDDKSTGIN